MSAPYQGQSTDPSVPGITGENTAGQNSVGVKGVVKELGWGVLGESTSGTGVVGTSQTSYAMYAKSEGASGILAESTNADGVYGVSHANNAVGVSGHNDHGRGVAGFSQTFQGVYGFSDSQAGVVGESNSFDGVFGISHSSLHAAVSGHNKAGGSAGYFDGNVAIDGDLKVRGEDVLKYIHDLEQRIAHLENRLNFMNNAKIYMTDQYGQGYPNHDHWVISGNGFTPSGGVELSFFKVASVPGDYNPPYGILHDVADTPLKSVSTSCDGVGNFQFPDIALEGPAFLPLFPPLYVGIVVAKDLATGLTKDWILRNGSGGSQI